MWCYTENNRASLILLEATIALRKAIQAGELDAVEGALAARDAAFAAGEPATPEILNLGTEALRELQQFRSSLRSEAAALSGLEQALGHSVCNSSLDVRG
jgi:hypothetical protein